MPSDYIFTRLASAEPNMGILCNIGTFFGVDNQTFFVGHNPYRTGDDAAKPQLGVVFELRYKPGSSADETAEGYLVWTNDSGDQIRPIGFVGNYVTEQVLVTISGETYFLDDNIASPTQLATISRTGLITSVGGANKAFYAQGVNRNVLLADKIGPTAVPVVATSGGTEVTLGSTGWSKVNASGPWHFPGMMFPDGGVTLPNDVPIQSAGGDTLIQFSSSQVQVGDPDKGMTIQSNVIYVLVDGTYIMNIEGAGVGIGTGLSSPAASSILDLTSTTKGMLPPRMTTTQRDAIASPVTGLTVYNTTTKHTDEYDGSAWVGQQADTGALTSNGASADRTLVDVTTLLAADPAKINANFDDVADAINDIRAALRAAKIMA